MTQHKIKILPEYFNSVLNGQKRFEIRNNDRNYQVGDVVTLEEYNADKRYYTGRVYRCEITYITNFMQKENYIVFGFKEI